MDPAACIRLRAAHCLHGRCSPSWLVGCSKHHACHDPFCPLHSGKRFLQLSVTDDRPLASIDFSALLAARFQMVTITLSAENAQVLLPLLLLLLVCVRMAADVRGQQRTGCEAAAAGS